MKQIEQHRLNNNWTYAKKLWIKKQVQYNLISWTLFQDCMYDKIGVCDYNTKTITLSNIFMRGASCNYKRVKKALLHEIAHALEPGQGHNSSWVKRCKEIGGNPALSDISDLPGMNWALICRKCKWRQEYQHKIDVTNKICGACKNPVYIKYIK